MLQGDAIDVANGLFEKELFEFAQPDFLYLNLLKPPMTLGEYPVGFEQHRQQFYARRYR